ncbi:MAG: flagellar assembly peptidoglycan hydrolase FlgJ [Pseudolabrys sp.]|nr:flagellar assembly peptidoglycan hydrolase FlgJ [Pseudolabrys sp.]
MSASLTTALPVPGLSAIDALKAQGTPSASGTTMRRHMTPDQLKAKAKASSEDFEAVFLNSMFQQMFTATDGEGPFGGSGATGVWRSFLTDEYAKNFAKAGGIGIAGAVYDTLLAQQEIRP